jgi:hypothetical protein
LGHTYIHCIRKLKVIWKINHMLEDYNVVGIRGSKSEDMSCN